MKLLDTISIGENVIVDWDKIITEEEYGSISTQMPEVYYFSPKPPKRKTSYGYTLKTTTSLSKYVPKPDYNVKSLSDCRVVYGGGHTILLNKKTGKRICQVTKDDTDENSLVRAVLYLVLKWKGVGGTEIQQWASGFMQYAQLRMKREFDSAFLKWLLEYGAKSSYSRSEINDILDRIYYRIREGNAFNAFLYFICEDRFGIKTEEISELVCSAVCSEKPKKEKTMMEKLADKDINTLDLEVNDISSDEITGVEAAAILKEVLDKVLAELKKKL